MVVEVKKKKLRFEKCCVAREAEGEVVRDAIETVVVPS